MGPGLVLSSARHPELLNKREAIEATFFLLLMGVRFVVVVVVVVCFFYISLSFFLVLQIIGS